MTPDATTREELALAEAAASRYQRGEIAARVLAAHVARTPHGHTVAGVQSLAIHAVTAADALVAELARPTSPDAAGKRVGMSDAIASILESRATYYGLGAAVAQILAGSILDMTVTGLMENLSATDRNRLLDAVHCYTTDRHLGAPVTLKRADRHGDDEGEPGVASP